MNHKKYNWILYIISSTILLTIGSQVYWNYKNYQTNKQQFFNDVQISLDNAVSNYHANIAKTDFLTFIDVEGDSINEESITVEKKMDSIFINNILKGAGKEFERDIIGFTQIIKPDSIHKAMTYIEGKGVNKMSFYRGKKALDSIKSLHDSLQTLQDITTIYVSIQRDSLDFVKLKSLLEKELNRKNISIPYEFRHYKNNQIFNKQKGALNNKNYFSTFSNTTYLKDGEKLELLFTDKSKIILQRGLLGVLLSLLLSLAIIASLFYLLHIIKKQKELAVIKNDLISNITHEFKTPITTASTALEALNHFDALQDSSKTKDYIEISSNQLKKLHLMVEKLLETATLDSENLLLKKEKTDIIDLVKRLTQRQQKITIKEINFSTNKNELVLDIDLFHFENAINNLIDNAVKYGGNNIKIKINTTIDNNLEINIIDDGNGIEKNQQIKIFNKFYRVPKGNTHDVKGFGIGLYYAKKIIEKHGGEIKLTSSTNQTIFKIELPL